MDFLTSDHHFYRKNIIKYCERPFLCIEEMNEFMVGAWNSVVVPYDTVYHLGDFGLGSVDKLFSIEMITFLV